MPITINGSGTLTGISAGGLPDGVVQPADLSTGAPSWTSGGDLSFNSGYGSAATAYGCRAWVNFNGTTASPSTRRGSGNVSSVTKNGTGDYTINFATAMPDANYTTVVANSYNRFMFTQDQAGSLTRTTSQCACGFNDSVGRTDPVYMEIAVFR